MTDYKLPFAETGPQPINRRLRDFPSGHPVERYQRNAGRHHAGEPPAAPLEGLVDMPGLQNMPPEEPPIVT